MIKINNIPLCKEEYSSKKLPVYFTEEEKQLADSGKDVLEKGIQYSISIPSFSDEKDKWLESLVGKHVEYDHREKEGKEATCLIYGLMNVDWDFWGVKDTFIDSNHDLRFILKFSDCDSTDTLLVETDVIEYGMSIAMEVIEKLQLDKVNGGK